MRGDSGSPNGTVAKSIIIMTIAFLLVGKAIGIPPRQYLAMGLAGFFTGYLHGELLVYTIWLLKQHQGR